PAGVRGGATRGGGGRATAPLAGARPGRRTGPADLTGLIEGADANAIVALLAPGGASGRVGNPVPGRLLVKASGVPTQGLASLASVDAGDLALSFRGQLVARDSGN